MAFEPTWIALAVALALAVFVAWVYNALVRLRVLCDNAWADIDVQLKRRHDLIPNLVETVKGYAAHERRTLEAVVEARNRALAAEGPAARGEAEGALGGALRQLFALAEAYPQLRATESFARLHDALSEIEDHLQKARRYYNAVVRDLNTKVEQVPSNLVAATFGFAAREFFQLADATEREVPRVGLEGAR